MFIFREFGYGDAANLLDLVYDGVLRCPVASALTSAVPPVQLLDGVVRNGARALTRRTSALSLLTAVKHGNCSSLTPLQPGTHQKILRRLS